MVQKIHPRVVIWVPSSSPPAVILGPSKQPMRRPSIKKSVHYGICRGKCTTEGREYLLNLHPIKGAGFELSNKELFVRPEIVLNAKSSLSLWSKWQIGPRKWFLNTNLFLIKPFLIAKFDCISILTFSCTKHFPSFLILDLILVQTFVLEKDNNCMGSL